MKRTVGWICAAALAAGVPGAAGAQGFPTKTIRIVTGGAGGGNDIAARIIAQALGASIGQQVIVENRASGFIPGETVAKAAPDGHTVALSGRSHWIAPLTVPRPPYEPTRDFAAVTLPASTPNVLAAHPSLPVRSVRELITFARARPGELNYGASGVGSGPHLAAEVFKSMAKVDIVRVNYRAMGAVYVDVMAGQVHLAFGSAPGVMPHVQSGRLRGLAVTSAEPSQLAPGLPTVAASGLPGYAFVSPFGVFAPAATPKPVVDALNQAIVRVLRQPDVRDRFFKAGMEVVGSTPAELDAMVKQDMAALGPIVRPAGGAN